MMMPVSRVFRGFVQAHGEAKASVDEKNEFPFEKSAHSPNPRDTREIRGAIMGAVRCAPGNPSMAISMFK
jgi:hypothetical protein